MKNENIIKKDDLDKDSLPKKKMKVQSLDKFFPKMDPVPNANESGKA